MKNLYKLKIEKHEFHINLEHISMILPLRKSTIDDKDIFNRSHYSITEYVIPINILGNLVNIRMALSNEEEIRQNNECVVNENYNILDDVKYKNRCEKIYNNLNSAYLKFFKNKS